MTATVAIVGTCDTKLNELIFLRDEIRKHGNNTRTLLIDVGRQDVSDEAIDVPRSEIVSAHDPGLDSSNLSRGDYLNRMSHCAAKFVQRLGEQGDFGGIIAAGGSCGTSLASAVMRRLPIGMPKMIVSTVASGDTGPIVGESDITLMYSVVDVAGLNQLLRDILSNAGAAIAAATLSFAKRQDQSTKRSGIKEKKRVAITMFGVTTPCVDKIRHHLESKYAVETYVFHATGHGGRAMERLIRDGKIDAVIDVTTTEICDFVMGGLMSAGSGRLDAALEAGIPNIISVGALDMANFGAKDTVPAKYSGRLQAQHNSLVTLVRSSPSDCKAIAEFMGRKVAQKAASPHLTQLWIPRGGVSSLSVPGGPFYDANADAELFHTLKTELDGSGVDIIEEDVDINEAGFATRIAEAMAKLIGLSKD